MRRSSLRASVAAQLVLTLSLASSAALADDDCPPGSVHKTQDGFTWCEPTVCTTDDQCRPNEVCRRVGLCMEVGTLADAASVDAGKRLVVTQRCAPDSTCPQKQTCSDLNRCLSKAAAERMGILHVAAAPSATPAPGSAVEPKKSACDCGVVGGVSGGPAAPACAALVAACILAARRRRGR